MKPYFYFFLSYFYFYIDMHKNDYILILYIVLNSRMFYKFVSNCGIVYMCFYYYSIF